MFRLLDSELYYRLHATYRSPKEYGWRWLSGKREPFLTAKVSDPPEWMTDEARRFVEERLKRVRWRPKVDWLYRQYAVGVGEKAPDAERALRQVLGAAAGWIDRPLDEEVASLLVQMMQSRSADFPRGWQGPLQALPYLLKPDHGGHPNLRNQIVLFLYDDFGFYRGLLGDLVRWAAANPTQRPGHAGTEGSGAYRTLGLAYYGSFTMRWAFGIGRATRWFSRNVSRLPDGKGFDVRLTNGLPWAQPSLWLHTHEVGLKPSHRPAVWLRLKEPAWRRPAELRVRLDGEAIRVRATKRMRVRLYPRALRPDWAPARTLTLTHRPPDGAARRLDSAAEWNDKFVEWDAEAGQYELR